MNIHTSDNIPDSTYFTMCDVTPEYNVATDTLTTYTGEGKRRSWGRPQCTSTVVLKDESLVAIHVGFSHKHRGGQGWHYFARNGQGWHKVTWGKLDDEARQQVFDNLDKAPIWAKRPGKLKSERQPITYEKAYKMVEVRDGRFLSLYDNQVEYALGRRMAQRAEEDHEGGYYAYRVLKSLRRAYDEGELVPSSCWTGVSQVAILEVEIGGNTVIYDNGKYAATYLRPLSVVEVFDVQRA